MVTAFKLLIKFWKNLINTETLEFLDIYTNTHIHSLKTSNSPSPLTQSHTCLIASMEEDKALNYITVLSIDGGGVRGIIPGVILACLESQLQV